jgi:hypothetical protein
LIFCLCRSHSGHFFQFGNGLVLEFVVLFALTIDDIKLVFKVLANAVNFFPMVARDEILSMILLEEEVRLVEFETLRDKEKEKLLQQLHNLDERLGEYLIGR